jgi:L-glyceraldehyde 3-phosphate reductase
MMYQPNESRYDKMLYRRCGKSGLKLPAISLGLWQNFGGDSILENSRAMIHRAFDLGINHFDLANNYGPPPGSAEETFGIVLRDDLQGFRDELVISSKAGYLMWPGPYGEWGTRKYLIASLDQSLQRMGLEYVDIFYSHRPDPDTPLEETMSALDQVVRQGKALYVGLSNYSPEQATRAIDILDQLGTPCLIHQPCYSMLERQPEEGLFDVLNDRGVGSIAFCPLAQGLLTDKYVTGVPNNSRASRDKGLEGNALSDQTLGLVNRLNQVATKRGQSLAQLALAWTLRPNHATSALIGASKVEQIEENVKTLDNLTISDKEIEDIETILSSA